MIKRYAVAAALLVIVTGGIKTPIGRVATQIDFADYRDAGGIKFPYRLLFAWLDGRDAIQLNRIELNVSIPENKFGKPDAAKDH